MSIFNELLPKINEISKTYTKNFDDDLKVVFKCFDKFEEEFQNGRSRTREKAQKGKLTMTTLQSINEDEGNHSDERKNPASDKSDRSSTSSNERRASKKRSKNEVEGILSPEQDKRQKRNASVKAQTQISRQVNVNLTQKLRRENSTDKVDKSSTQAKGRRNKDDNKENAEPNETAPVLQIKLEKISLPPEPMDTEPLPVNIEVKQEPNKDDIAMPPPAAPVPKPRKGVRKNKSNESKESDDESSTKPRTTRTKKQTEPMPPPPVPVPSARSTRSSSRTTRQLDHDEPPPSDARPKRTRAKKKVSDVTSTDTEKDTTQSSQENLSSAVSSPAEKPRPKRTRRGQKAAEKQDPPKKPEIPVTPKEERTTRTEISSPILQKEIKISKPTKKDKTQIIEDSIIQIDKTNNETMDKTKSETINKTKNETIDKTKSETINKTNGKKDKTKNEKITEKVDVPDVDKVDLAMDETRILSRAVEMDQTIVLPNGVYNHAPVTPKAVRTINETIVVESNRETIVIEKASNVIMDATVVLDKGPSETNMTEDNSLLTDDSDSPVCTPPSTLPPQPSSAVKEKVQQFEELATRVTRTKTRAMAKKAEEQPDTDTHTPPDKVSKPVLSAETLKKMNNLIFNGKAPQISSSASKPRAIPISTTKTQIPSSMSKLTARTTDVDKKHEVEDPRQKKEAMLEAKRELQRRKREEKMAAAAAAREAAERERLAAADAAAREKRDKVAQANAGKVARLKEVERKKQEYLRKVAITEERRKAEEAARLQRLEDEQKRMEAQRRKQVEEQLQMKKEEAIMAKEIEKRQKEYIEKQKKQRMEEKMHTPGFHVQLEPVYMADGFQYLNSDEDEEPPPRPVPDWSTSKARKQQLEIQAAISQVHIDRLFSVQVHSPDLRDIFPNIDRSRLKRTSSAVWRTPPHLPPVKE